MISNALGLPKMGHRITKSAIAVFLCFVVDIFRNGTPFYSALAALQCMQPYKSSTKEMAIQRVAGTFMGATYGLIVLLIKLYILDAFRVNIFIYYSIVSLFVMLVLYTTVILKKKSISYFSCVVFLSIVVVHNADANPYLFVANRVIDTLIGVAIGIFVNSIRLHYKVDKETLFVSGLDDVILEKSQSLSDYSIVALNRMIDNGVKFTIMTARTTGSFLDVAKGINFNLPVILMNGAVLYDIKNNSYLKKYEIPYLEAVKIEKYFNDKNHNCFINIIEENTVIILHQAIKNPVEIQIYEQMRKSPYRNYLSKPMSHGDNVVYFMVVDEKPKIIELFQEMQNDSFFNNFQVVCERVIHFEDFFSIKVYSKQATKTNMLAYFKNEYCIKKSVTIGSLQNMYDIIVDENNIGDDVVKIIHRESHKLI